MIRVLVADDHAVVRRGLCQILSETPDMLLAGEAVNAQETLATSRARLWDVLVLDISMPGRSGFDILKELRRELPRLPILILSIYPEEQLALRALRAGASGYLTKESAPDELIKAIRKVACGGKYISPNLAETLAFRMDAAIDQPPHQTLSDREFQVLLMIAAGRSPSEIAAELLLSVKTISTYRTRILEKMGLKTNAEIMRYAVQYQLSN